MDNKIIEINIKEKKKKLRFDITMIRIYSFALAAVLISAGVAISSKVEKDRFEASGNAAYLRAFTELVDYICSINTQLEKILYTTTPKQMANIGTQMIKQVGSAKSNLGQLPLSDMNIDNMQNFLAQSGDYVFTLTKKVIEEGEIGDADRSNIRILRDYAAKLADKLVSVQDYINTTGKADTIMQILEIKLSEEKLPNIGSFGEVERIFTDYPRLIYDGPFSSHMSVKPFIMIDTASEISVVKAKEIACAFLGQPSERVVENGRTVSNLTTYNFTGGTSYIQVSQKGGYVVNMLVNREIGTQTISDENALERAKLFLNQKGLINLRETYFVENNGMLIVNFAAMQEDITLYPDLIKVGVALDNGEIALYEAAGYLQNHTIRAVEENILTPEEAQAKLSQYLKINTTAKSYIPTTWYSEVFCYEFNCTTDDGKEILIYLNAVTGAEEDMLLVIDTGHGKLTV